MKTVISVYKNIESENEIYWNVEAGLSLYGFEVKKIRKNFPSIRKCYCSIINGSVFLKNLTNRDIQLLLHKKQIKKMYGLYSKTSRIIIIKELYDIRGKIKVDLCIAKKLSKFDKRKEIIKKDMKRRDKFHEF